MSNDLDRRQFLGRATVSGAALGLAMKPNLAAASRASNRIVVGATGMGGQGRRVAQNFQRLEGVEVAYVCDPDRERVEQAAGAVREVGGENVKTVTDYRTIIEDDAVDVLITATPNHWHAPMTIEACAAGKHVYVEKPCSHNPREGELIVAAARAHNRAVQHGTQRRSGDAINEAIQLLHNGEIGNVYYARSWYANTRGSIGKGEAADPPEHIDYELWQGPAPRRDFRSNYLHYNWHWFWHWGNGESGNNGVHALDLVRWGLQVDYPIRVTAAGGRFAFDDDQQTPDTQVITFDFEDGRSASWEGLSCNAGLSGRFGASFHGTDGTLRMLSDGYVLYDRGGEEVQRKSGDLGSMAHVENFVDAIRSDDPARLNAGAETAHKSTLLPQLGNIAYRTGRTLNCDASTGRIVDDDEAMDRYWSREYASGWEPTV